MSEFKINALSDRVIIKPSKNKEKTASGIILPHGDEEKPIEGIVVAVGPGKVTNDGKIVQPTVKVNDKVLFGKYGGAEILIDEEEYLILHESDIFGTINLNLVN